MFCLLSLFGTCFCARQCFRGHFYARHIKSVATPGLEQDRGVNPTEKNLKICSKERKPCVLQTIVDKNIRIIHPNKFLRFFSA